MASNDHNKESFSLMRAHTENQLQELQNFIQNEEAEQKMLGREPAQNEITQVDSSRDPAGVGDVENSQKRSYKINKNFATYCTNKVEKVDINKHNPITIQN